MEVVLVNLFDPLPGEKLRSGRYRLLCRQLARRGHSVRWYTSDFSHAFKSPRNTETITAAAREEGYEVVFLPSPPYHSNASLARLRSHAQSARALAQRLTGERRADVVLASTPEPAAARQAARWAKSHRAAFVLDVQDLWPETFARFLPGPLRWVNPILFSGTARHARNACRSARAVVGVADGYVEHYRRYISRDARTVVLPLGVNLTEFDENVKPIREFDFDKPPEQKWIFLGGLIVGYIDYDAALDMMCRLRARNRKDIHLIVAGSGPGEQAIRRKIRRRELASVRMLGMQPYDAFASLAVASDVALLPVKAKSEVFLPNRLFDYLAAGIPIVSSIPGQAAEILSKHHAGITCDACSGAALSDAVEQALRDTPVTEPDHRLRRGNRGTQFDRPSIVERFCELLEDISNG